MEPNILGSMLVMTFGLWVYSFATVLMRVRNLILIREVDTNWVKAAIAREQGE